MKEKKWLIVLGAVTLIMFTVFGIISSKEQEQREQERYEIRSRRIEEEKERESSEVKKEVVEEPEEVDKRVLAKENSEKYPATGTFDYSHQQFSGMDYHYIGNAVRGVDANAVGDQVVKSLLVENEHGYQMIISPYTTIETEIYPGDKIEAYGHLNGDFYDISNHSPEAMNSKAGLINAYEIYINDELVGRDIF